MSQSTISSPIRLPLKVLPDFTTLSDSTSICIPPPSNETPNPDHPSMVILCTWLGNAQLKHIAKYTSGYRTLLPHAQILLIRSQVPDLTFRTYIEQKRRLEPTQAAIQSCLSSSSSTSPNRGNGNGHIILHMFSHGGANTAIQIALLLKQNNLPFPLQAIILDSTPGRGSFSENHAALKVSLPRAPFSRFLFQLLLVPLLVFIKIAQVVGLMHGIEDMRKALLDEEEVFGGMVKRLYLYSKADVMVGWRDVEAHAEEARRRGLVVDEVVWEREGHCGLVVGDGGKRYWDAVGKVL